VGDLRQHGGVRADFILHPLIHTSGRIESSTKCGGRLFRDKVWIKVWQVNSQGKVGGVRLTQSYSFQGIR
jgi:hypothetical protein